MCFAIFFVLPAKHLEDIVSGTGYTGQVGLVIRGMRRGRGEVGRKPERKLPGESFTQNRRRIPRTCSYSTRNSPGQPTNTVASARYSTPSQNASLDQNMNESNKKIDGMLAHIKRQRHVQSVLMLGIIALLALSIATDSIPTRSSRSVGSNILCRKCRSQLLRKYFRLSHLIGTKSFN
jgi:hypothetical protein